MIELYEGEQFLQGRRSSKGNQLKWKRGDTWYKADYAGYEGLAEYVVSALLCESDLEKEEFVPYRTQQIRFSFTAKKVRELLSGEPCYSKDIKNRVERILLDRMRKYAYLFSRN